MNANVAEADVVIVDVAIVGAGLAGCTAAILLASAGLSVALIEKRVFPRRKVCGECVAASNLPLLRRLGVLDAVLGSAGPSLSRVVLQRGSSNVTARLPATRGPSGGHGFAIGRDLFDRLMRDRALSAGAHVLQPWRVFASNETDDSGHRLTLRKTGDRMTRILDSRVLIDAHGSWEPLVLDGVSREPRPVLGTDLFAFKANFTGSEQPSDEIAVLALDGGYGGMVQEGGGRATVACCIRRDRLTALRAAHPGRSAGEVVEAWLRRGCRGVDAALVHARRDGRWLASGPLAPGIRAGAAGARTVLRIGNAAGEAHPILGEGMSMAMQSGAMLADRLIEAGPLDARGIAALNRRYGRAYRRRFTVRIGLAALFAHLAMRPRASAVLQRIVAAVPVLLTAGARLGGKVRTPPSAYAPRPPSSTRTTRQ